MASVAQRGAGPSRSPGYFGQDEGAIAARLADGRLHLQHGPIDIIVQAHGPCAEAAEVRAIRRFASILGELVAELPGLREEAAVLHGGVARRMAAAVRPFRPDFITPMAAVAGAVAEEVLAAMAGPGVTRAYVNNGGDIALLLGPGEVFRCAMATGGRIEVSAETPIRGIATSGRGGRSLSRGIADAVTVLARTAAMADAAATMIANAVDLPGDPRITRVPARARQAESDLGDRLVTVAVPDLAPGDRARALEAGLRAAEAFRARGLIEAAALFLQGEVRVAGRLPLGDGHG